MDDTPAAWRSEARRRATAQILVGYVYDREGYVGIGLVAIAGSEKKGVDDEQSNGAV